MWKCTEKTEQVGDTHTWVHLKFIHQNANPKEGGILSGWATITVDKSDDVYAVGDEYAALESIVRKAKPVAIASFDKEEEVTPVPVHPKKRGR